MTANHDSDVASTSHQSLKGWVADAAAGWHEGNKVVPYAHKIASKRPLKALCNAPLDRIIGPAGAVKGAVVRCHRCLRALQAAADEARKQERASAAKALLKRGRRTQKKLSSTEKHRVAELTDREDRQRNGSTSIRTASAGLPTLGKRR